LHVHMANDARTALGRRGEEIAARHLERAGWTIVTRNYRVREGEIDVIARRDTTLAFCEVKTLVARGRSRSGPANPIEAVGPQKRARVRKMARIWIAARAAEGALRGTRELRLDVIGVVLSPAGELVRLEHVEAAF